MRSKLAVRWVMLAFGVVFLAGGAIAAYGMVLAPMVRARDAQTWRETTCQVTSAEIVEGRTSKGRAQFRPAIAYTYAHDGQAYAGSRLAFTPVSWSGDRDDAADVVARYPVGADVPCWYDPASPASVTLSRDIRTSLWLAFPLPFLLVGLVTLRIGARMRRDARPGTPADDGRIAYRRRGGGGPELVAASLIVAVFAMPASLAVPLGLATVGWIAFGLAIVAGGWLAHELRCACSVVTVHAPAALTRGKEARLSCDVRTPWCAPPVTARATAVERKRAGKKIVEHTVATIVIVDGVLRVDGPPSREEPDGFVEWHVEVRTHLPYGPDLHVRAPIRVD